METGTSPYLQTHVEKREKEENEPPLLSKPQKMYLILNPTWMGHGVHLELGLELCQH